MRLMKEVLEIPSRTFWVHCKWYHLSSSTQGKDKKKKRGGGREIKEY